MRACARAHVRQCVCARVSVQPARTALRHHRRRPSVRPAGREVRASSLKVSGVRPRLGHGQLTSAAATRWRCAARGGRRVEGAIRHGGEAGPCHPPPPFPSRLQAKPQDAGPRHLPARAACEGGARLGRVGGWAGGLVRACGAPGGRLLGSSPVGDALRGTARVFCAAPDPNDSGARAAGQRSRVRARTAGPGSGVAQGRVSSRCRRAGRARKGWQVSGGKEQGEALV